MKILVLSDSHSADRFMNKCVEAVKPDAVIHLGDLVRDGEYLSADYPDLRFYQVAGNCDLYRTLTDYPEVSVENFCGVRVFFTHGHLHGVKQYLDKLIADGRRCGADIVLYGHTHAADCHRLDDGMWVINPGSAGNYGGTAAVLTIEGRDQIQCNIISQRDLEEMQ